MNLSTKQKQIHRLREQTYGCQGEGYGEVIGNLRWTCTLPYLKMDNQPGPVV